MAILRFLYRRKQCLFLILCASTFWIAYIFLTLPSNIEKKEESEVHIETSDLSEEQKASISRKITQNPVQKEGHLENPVIEPPQLDDDQIYSEGNDSHQNSSLVRTTNLTNPVKPVGNLDKVLEIGEKIKNKTLEVGAKFKNKTLEKLSEIGVIKSKTFVKYIYEANAWSANLSMDDVANIMKDTKYFNKLQELEKSYQRIVPQFFGKNKTVASNITNYGIGFCDCLETFCQCCVRVSNSRMHLNKTGCANFTFMSKSQELDLSVILDGTSVYKNCVSAEKPPEVCLGSASKVVDLCVEFKNMTSHIEMHEEHKIHLFGCVDLTLNLFNKTVSSFPIDCFQLPTDEDLRKQHLEKRNMNFGNWMP